MDDELRKQDQLGALIGSFPGPLLDLIQNGVRFAEASVHADGGEAKISHSKLPVMIEVGGNKSKRG